MIPMPEPSLIKPTERQVVLAAAELASQERYNPAWCKPGVGTRDHADQELYQRRARLILDAALGARR